MIDTSYYESAEGMTITRQRAIEEYETHGMENAEHELIADLGDHKAYEAQDVLSMLGY